MCWGYIRAKHSVNQSFYKCIKNNRRPDSRGSDVPRGIGLTFQARLLCSEIHDDCTCINSVSSLFLFGVCVIMLCSDVLLSIAHCPEALKNTLMFCKDVLSFSGEISCFEPCELFMFDGSKIRCIYTIGTVSSFCSMSGFFLKLAF